MRHGGLVLAALLTAAPAAVAGQEFVTCPGPSTEARSGLAGTVVDVVDDVTIPGARVVASWTDADGVGHTEVAETDGSGVYRLCGLPTLTSMVVQATFAGFSSESARVRIEPGPPAGWDFEIAVEDAAVQGDASFPGRIIGRVTDRDSGRPVENVDLSLEGEEGRRISDGEGRFTFENLTPGIYRIGIRHVAYDSTTQVVNVPANRTVELDVALSTDPIELEPIVVSVVRHPRLETRGFYQRRELGERLGQGVFMDREEIRRQNATRITHILGRVNGVRINCTGSGVRSCSIMMTGGQPSLRNRAEVGCSNANVYVDGVRVIRDNQAAPGSIDEFVSPTEIVGVEVYRGPAELPAEFGGSVGRCGAIVIWTGSD